MDLHSIVDFLVYLGHLIQVFFTNGFITLYIIAKHQFVIFLGVVAVAYLVIQENKYIIQSRTKIKKRLL
jgi:hypothetical protein